MIPKTLLLDEKDVQELIKIGKEQDSSLSRMMRIAVKHYLKDEMAGRDENGNTKKT